MRKDLEQKFTEEFLSWTDTLGYKHPYDDKDEWHTIPRPKEIKSFFDSQIKQAAQEIRGMKTNLKSSDEFYDGMNHGLEMAARHLESLL